MPFTGKRGCPKVYYNIWYENAKGALKYFFENTPKDRMADFTTSVSVKCCGDNKLKC